MAGSRRRKARYPSASAAARPVVSVRMRSILCTRTLSIHESTARLAKLADAIRFAVGDVENAVGGEEAVRARQLATKRACLRTVAARARAEHGGDHAGLEVDAADGVIFGVG